MFIKLTTPGYPKSQLEPLPIYVAVHQIHTINPRRVRVDTSKPAIGPEDWKIEGAFIATSGGEDEGFAVMEAAEDILRAIVDFDVLEVSPVPQPSPADIARWKGLGIAHHVNGKCTSCEKPASECECLPF